MLEGPIVVYGEFEAQVMCPWCVMVGRLASWSCYNRRWSQPMLEGLIVVHVALDAQVCALGVYWRGQLAL